MRVTLGPFVCLNSLVQGEFFSSFSSSAFSSSYSNMNGEEHSESKSEEQYSERDSKGLNRRGSGQLITEDGNQVFEKTENCDGGRCTSTIDTGKRRLLGKQMRRSLRS
jgi:hypothetical protein